VHNWNAQNDKVPRIIRIMLTKLIEKLFHFRCKIGNEIKIIAKPISKIAAHGK